MQSNSVKAALDVKTGAAAVCGGAAGKPPRLRQELGPALGVLEGLRIAQQLSTLRG